MGYKANSMIYSNPRKGYGKCHLSRYWFGLYSSMLWVFFDINQSHNRALNTLNSKGLLGPSTDDLCRSTPFDCFSFSHSSECLSSVSQAPESPSICCQGPFKVSGTKPGSRTTSFVRTFARKPLIREDGQVDAQMWNVQQAVSRKMSVMWMSLEAVTGG